MTRLYNGNFGEGKRVVLLCDGGDKRTQTVDIERAIERWNEWQTRGKK
jgi:putative component of toxin-antitoxin plasmid stabilization module